MKIGLIYHCLSLCKLLQPLVEQPALIDIWHCQYIPLCHNYVLLLALQYFDLVRLHTTSPAKVKLNRHQFRIVLHQNIRLSNSQYNTRPWVSIVLQARLSYSKREKESGESCTSQLYCWNVYCLAVVPQ